MWRSCICSHTHHGNSVYIRYCLSTATAFCLPHCLQVHLFCNHHRGIKWRSFPFGYSGSGDIFRHSSAARLRLFVIKHWSPWRKEGTKNQNSSNYQSFLPWLRAVIDTQRCVRRSDRSSVSQSQTKRHLQQVQGGRELWRMWDGQGGCREKCNSRGMDKNTDTGEMKLCETSRGKQKEGKGVWVTEWLRLRGGGWLAGTRWDESVRARRDGLVCLLLPVRGSVLNCRGQIRARSSLSVGKHWLVTSLI